MKKSFYTMMIIFFFLWIPMSVFSGGTTETSPGADETDRSAESSRAETDNEAAGSTSMESIFSPGDTVIVDIDKAVEIALANNLQIKAEKIGLRIKKRNKETIYNYFYPSIQAGTTLSRMHEDPGTFSQLVGVPAEDLTDEGLYDYVTQAGTTLIPLNSPVDDLYGSVMKIEEEIPHTWNISASVNMNLTLTAALYFGIKATMIDYEAGRITLETAKKKLIRDVKKQFYNLLLIQENIRLMEENINAAEDRYEQASINYQNGLVSEYTKLSAQVAWENLKPALESLKVGYRTALLGVKQQLGLPNRVELELDGSIEPSPLSLEADPLIDEYVTGRLDIQSLRKQIEMVKNSKDATIAGMTPSLTFILSFDPTFTKDPFEDPWFDDEENWKQRSGMFGVSINVALDKLIPNSKTWVELKNTEDNLRKMEVSLAGLVSAAEMEIETTVMNLNKSLDSIETLEMNVDLAQRAYNMAEEAYNAGNRELLEVQNAELELKKAQLEVLKEKYNYITGLFDLEYALNTTLKELKG